MKNKYLGTTTSKTSFNYTLILCLLLLAFSACKKEYPSLPYSEIVNFTIKDNTGASIKAAIENNEITLYWPPAQEVPENISPVITVSDKATIQPASGTTVKFNENTVFTVTAEDGKTTTYKLKPVINSTKPYISSVSILDYNGYFFTEINSNITVNGDYFNTNANLTKIYFINNDNAEIPATISGITPIRADVATETPGLYQKVKIVSNNRSFTIDKTFEILAKSPAPRLATAPVAEPVTLKRGQEFTWGGGDNMEKVTLVQIRNSVTRVIVSLTLLEAKTTGWSLKVPADFPIGTYSLILYTYPESKYYAGGRATISTPLITITE